MEEAASENNASDVTPEADNTMDDQQEVSYVNGQGWQYKNYHPNPNVRNNAHLCAYPKLDKPVDNTQNSQGQNTVLEKNTQKEGSNLNYVIMAVDEQNELPEATQREAELQRQIDGLQSQVTELHKTREEANIELSSGFQSLKEKLNEHSKQLEQSAEMLIQLESENLNLREDNQALNTASNKKRRSWAQVRPMPTLETPNSGTGVNLPPTASGGDASMREKAKDAQTYDVEESKSEPEPDNEAPEGATKVESPMVAYLEQMFSKRLDAMQSMVERLPGVAPPPHPEEQP
ncbi:hypothetical protein F2Q70_00017806 [Brassica cretica]|uniref:Uncharacterized protein n=1 Tax=Brassica cretica TaxID=69181 RepID=A0A8S9L356_BRACR|nr:hypothetical protein F2Q70_00017806 [Brassica cretica]KAF2600542.1 hypothetical protein F2Q68_00010749 [Brassica cretica]